jgi:hypothetical protein
MKFDIIDVKPRLPYHVSFKIDVVYANNIIKRIVFDEGASMCIMSLSCWKAINSPDITSSLTFLTAF